MRREVDLLVYNIGELVSFKDTVPGRITHKDAGVIRDAGVAVDRGRIVYVGGSEDAVRSFKGREEVDAAGKLVTPGLIDTHTHMVFAGSREDEFEKKLQGYSYEEILRSGGGIYRTVNATKQTSVEELVARSEAVAWSMIRNGSTVIEVKGGYGLYIEEELKIMEAAKKLAGRIPARIVATMQAHVVPVEYKDDRSRYIEYYVGMLEEAYRRRLAVYSDVFCDEGAFTPGETRRILGESLRLGFRLRIHADQLSYRGCSMLAREYPLDALDHLDHMPPENAAILAESGSAAGLTPTSQLAMFSKASPPVEALRRHKVPIALGTDYNPNNMTPNMQLVVDLSTYMYRFTPLEALAAATVNAAYSLRIHRSHGRIKPGYRADLLVWNIPNHRWIGYLWGVNKVERVYIGGTLVWVNPEAA